MHMAISLTALAKALNDTGLYATEPDGDALWVRRREDDSSYTVWLFEGSFQIRQEIVSNEDMSGRDAYANMAVSLAMINDRFICSKLTIDRGGSVINCCDIPGEVASADHVQRMIEQVEWVSGALFDLLYQVVERGAAVTEAELDEAFSA